MTRLQKKCLIAAAGTHFLLVIALMCSGFMKPKPVVDDSTVLTILPDIATDKPVESGVRNAQPPPPPPPTPPPPPPQPQQEPPTPKPEEPQVTKPELPEPKPKPENRHKIEISLKPVVRNTATEKDNSEAEKRAAEKRARDARAKLIKSALNNIEKHTSPATTIDMPAGTSTVAYANYATIVKSVYTSAWQPPNSADNDDANVKVSITIARDGHVIEAHIIDKSGDSGLDRSIQDTLDRVTEIRPFPDDSNDKQRTYIINFNLKAKRELG